MKVVHSRAEFVAARAELTGPVGVTLTMGALHDGHEALMQTARAECESVVATVFVNPAQFGEPADLERYPRTLDDDVARAEKAGVDLLWAPAVADIYPVPPRIGLDPGPLGRELEGSSRPGHFAGMLLVVNKFLQLIAPQRAYFGQKDYQQLVLIAAMAQDLDFDTEIVGVPTVREPDGLALSSRNIFLSPSERAQASALSAALRAGADAGPGGPIAVLTAARAVLDDADVHPDYLELRTPMLEAVTSATFARSGDARLLVAARLGATRLIDNIAVTVGS